MSFDSAPLTVITMVSTRLKAELAHELNGIQYLHWDSMSSCLLCLWHKNVLQIDKLPTRQ